MYETSLLDNNFVFQEKTNKMMFIDEKYILGEDKFPLDKNKMGILLVCLILFLMWIQISL